MIYTFYSYKGGVGRSMALANVAELLYQAGWKVLMVDWDLEAPGLEQYFPLDLDEVLNQPGVIDMLLGYKEQIAERLPVSAGEDETLPFEKPDQFTIDIYPHTSGPGRLLLLPAGKRHPEGQFAAYARAVHTFDWVDFYQNWEGELYFDWLWMQFEQMADVVLIDSRTGVTEMGGVCTQQLADTVLMFCTPNQQSFDGTYEMAQRLKRDKIRQLRGGRPLTVLVVPARVEDRAEAELLSAFRNQFIEKFQSFLPETLQGELESLWDLKIPHVPYYAFDEIVAVREQGNTHEKGKGADDMIRAFTKLADVMTRLDPKLLPYEEAIDFYLSTKAWDKAASLLNNDKLKSFYHAGQAKTLDGWFSKFPLTELERHPRLLLWWGKILNDNFGQLKRAMTFFNLAEEQFRQQGDPISAVEAQIWQSVGLRMMGQANKAVDLASKGLDQLKTLVSDNNSWLIAWATRNRGLAYGTAGDIVKALADTRQALAQFSRLGDKYKYLVGLCHHDIGVSLAKQGNISQAEHHYRQAVHIWRELGNDNDLANTSVGLGQILSEAGRYDEALAQLNQGRDIALRIGAIRRAAFALAGIGDVYFRYKAYEQALKAYNLSIGYAQDAGVQSLEISNQVKLSECFLYLSQQYDLMKALEKARQARRMAAENGLSFEKGLASLVQAKVHIHLEQYADSFRLLDEAAAYFAENNVVEHVRARLWWGYGLYLDKKAPEAFSHLQVATKLMPAIDEIKLAYGLGQTVAEVSELLDSFLKQTDISTEARDGIRRLLMAQRQHEQLLEKYLLEKSSRI